MTRCRRSTSHKGSGSNDLMVYASDLMLSSHLSFFFRHKTYMESTTTPEELNDVPCIKDRFQVCLILVSGLSGRHTRASQDFCACCLKCLTFLVMNLVLLYLEMIWESNSVL